ncbi:MAG: ABC transporter ATP-binding protein [Acidobacteriales bacterium]|nr:ABC transporter ATP-binding protein [Terriglobales bacterium]
MPTSPLIRILRYVVPYGLQVAASVILLAMVGLLDAFRVLLIGPIFDRVLNPTTHAPGITLFTLPSTGLAFNLHDFVPAHFQNDWTVVAFALVVSTLLKGVCDYTGTYLVNYAGFGMITDLRNDLYNAILRRSVAFFHRHTTGTLLSTIINDVEKVQFAMSNVLGEFLQQLFTLLFTAVVVVLLGGKLAWVLVAFIPFVVFSSRKIGGRVRTTTRKGQDKLADIQNILQETISGNRIVKAFGMEAWEIARFREAARKLFRANLRWVRAHAISSPLMDAIGAIAIAFLLLLGRDQIKAGAFTAGTFLTFIIAVFKLYDPVRKFAQFNNSFQQAIGASSEIFRFMESEDDVKQKPSAAALKDFSKNVHFENVGFSYLNGNGEDKTILRDINLDARAGEVIAFVGSSGAGKTTLVNLIPRFFDVDSGRLLIDGHDVRDLTIASLRSQIGIVTQETILFNDTVRNNIAYGQPDVTDDKVVAAAQAALAHDFILRMPQGYDTVIGERGVFLSGGERQRIAIARAILKDAPILILDEATSSLDSESEALVQSALGNLMSGRTVFVIAHRLNTVRRADRIVVLENGTIAEIGTHDGLLQGEGLYKRLYDLQFVDAEAR